MILRVFGVPEEQVARIYEQASNVIATNAAFRGVNTTLHARWMGKQLFDFHEHLNHIATYGLFPLCLALLILHEQFRATSEGGAFRLAHVVARTVSIALAVFFLYGPLCQLITTVCGGKGGWMTGQQLLGTFEQSGSGLSSAWDNMGGDDDGFIAGIENRLASLPQFLALVLVWGIAVLSALFAYVSGMLISTAQAILIAILLAVGKTCLTLSLVPGIGVGKSWAKALGMVAAWSRIAGIISAMFVVGGGTHIGHILANADMTALLEMAARFVILAIFTLAVPAITSKIASGAVGSAAGAEGVVQKLYKTASGGVRSALARNVTSSRHPGQDGGGGPGRGHGGSGISGDSGRPFKTERSRLHEGLAVAGGLMLAPVAFLARRFGPKDEGPKPVPRADLGGRSEAGRRHVAQSVAPVIPAGSPGEARAASNGNPQAFREGEQVKQELALAKAWGRGWAPLDRDAMSHVARKPLTDDDRRVLRAAYPDLSFDRGALKPVEKGILGVLDHHGSRYEGWREGRQGQGDFAQARQLAQTYVQAKKDDLGSPATHTAVANPEQARVARAAMPVHEPAAAGTAVPPDDTQRDAVPAAHANVIRRPLPLPPPDDEPPAPLRLEDTVHYFLAEGQAG